MGECSQQNGKTLSVTFFKQAAAFHGVSVTQSLSLSRRKQITARISLDDIVCKQIL